MPIANPTSLYTQFKHALHSRSFHSLNSFIRSVPVHTIGDLLNNPPADCPLLDLEPYLRRANGQPLPDGKLKILLRSLLSIQDHAQIINKKLATALKTNDLTNIRDVFSKQKHNFPIAYHAALCYPPTNRQPEDLITLAHRIDQQQQNSDDNTLVNFIRTTGVTKQHILYQHLLYTIHQADIALFSHLLQQAQADNPEQLLSCLMVPQLLGPATREDSILLAVANSPQHKQFKQALTPHLQQPPARQHLHLLHIYSAICQGDTNALQRQLRTIRRMDRRLSTEEKLLPRLLISPQLGNALHLTPLVLAARFNYFKDILSLITTYVDPTHCEWVDFVKTMLLAKQGGNILGISGQIVLPTPNDGHMTIDIEGVEHSFQGLLYLHHFLCVLPPTQLNQYIAPELQPQAQQIITDHLPELKRSVEHTLMALTQPNPGEALQRLFGEGKTIILPCGFPSHVVCVMLNRQTSATITVGNRGLGTGINNVSHFPGSITFKIPEVDRVNAAWFTKLLSEQGYWELVRSLITPHGQPNQRVTPDSYILHQTQKHDNCGFASIKTVIHAFLKLKRTQAQSSPASPEQENIIRAIYKAITSQQRHDFITQCITIKDDPETTAREKQVARSLLRFMLLQHNAGPESYSYPSADTTQQSNQTGPYMICCPEILTDWYSLITANALSELEDDIVLLEDMRPSYRTQFEEQEFQHIVASIFDAQQQIKPENAELLDFRSTPFAKVSQLYYLRKQCLALATTYPNILTYLRSPTIASLVQKLGTKGKTELPHVLSLALYSNDFTLMQEILTCYPSNMRDPILDRIYTTMQTSPDARTQGSIPHTIIEQIKRIKVSQVLSSSRPFPSSQSHETPPDAARLITSTRPTTQPR